MKRNHVLVTGGYGCIGSETTKWLLRHTDSKVIICSRKVSPERTDRVFEKVARERLVILQADVTDQSALRDILLEQEISHVVHLAALQTPDCNEHRDLGLQINLAGTQNLIEAIKSSGRKLERFLFASSIAVYGPRRDYLEDVVPMLAEPNPVNVYGVWKLAGEHLAKLFCRDTGIATLSLRPGVLYGPGRDAGLTSTPTTAMKHLVRGLPYEIPFCSRQDYLYAPDVGGAMGNALMRPFEGYGIYTLPSLTITTEQFVESLRQVAKDMGLEKSFQITVGNEEVPFICDLEYKPFLAAFPEVPHTPLHQAQRESLECFMEQSERGWLQLGN